MLPKLQLLKITNSVSSTISTLWKRNVLWAFITYNWLQVNQRILNVSVVKDLNSIIFTVFTLVDFVHYTTGFSYPLASGRFNQCGILARDWTEEGKEMGYLFCSLSPWRGSLHAGWTPKVMAPDQAAVTCPCYQPAVLCLRLLYTLLTRTNGSSLTSLKWPNLSAPLLLFRDPGWYGVIYSCIENMSQHFKRRYVPILYVFFFLCILNVHMSSLK